VGDVPPKIIMSSASGAFSNVNILSLGQNGKNAVGILVKNATNVTLSGFSLEKTYDKNHYVRSIAIVGSKNVTLDTVSLSGISRGKSVISIDSSSFVTITNSRIYGNRLELLATLGGVSTEGLTAIQVDSLVALGGAYSNNIRISKNNIYGITDLPTTVATHGMNTAGISVARTETSKVIISDNVISHVGDGIEFFGLSGLISGNTIEDVYRYGVTLHNGASDNVVENNKIKWAGKVGVRIAGPTPYYNFSAVATFWPASAGSATLFVPGGGWSGQMQGASFKPAPGVNAMGNIISNNTITETGGGTLGQAGLWSVHQFTSAIALEGSVALTATGAARGNLVYGNTVDNGVMNSATKYAKYSFYCGSAFGDVLPGVHRNVYGVNTFGEAAVKAISTSDNCAIYGDVTTFPHFARDPLLSDFYLDVFKLPI
jgi:hypothetical protein